MIGPPTPLAAPPNRQATTGLIALAPVSPDEGDRPGGWENGFAFDPETCDDGLLYSLVCRTETPKAPADNAGLVEYTPVVIVGSDVCSTLDRSRDRVGRARRHLLAVQSFQLERAFWTGEATDDESEDGEDRPHLADGTAEVLASGDPVAPEVGLALLDQALTRCIHGQQGMVHVTPYTLAVWVGLDVVEFVNGHYQTPNGHVVVAGSGYTGGGPRSDPGQDLPTAPDLSEPADQWAYATPMVQVLLGDIDVIEDVDRSVNTETVRAERSAAAFHGCCKFAIQLDMTPEPEA